MNILHPEKKTEYHIGNYCIRVECRTKSLLPSMNDRAFFCQDAIIILYEGVIRFPYVKANLSIFKSKKSKAESF